MEGHQLILCIGGNLGEKAKIFAKTHELIAEKMGKIEISSPVYESPQWKLKSRKPFWNQVLAVKTTLKPTEILDKIREIESFFGRKRKAGTYLSRKMDIDILFYDELVIYTDELIIPHPRISERKFVLVPLADIFPDFLHPNERKTVAAMLDECIDTSEVTKVQSEV